MTKHNVKQKLIVVLGMHRSGTSAITRSLQVLGVGLGHSMLPARDYNAKGFWEDTDIYNLNIEMLNAINSDWDHIRLLQTNDVEQLKHQGYIKKAIDLLQQKVANVASFGFKDPRTTKLMPFWKQVFIELQWDVRYVFASRHPSSIVDSLSKRNAFDAEKSYLLWLSYTLEGLQHILNSSCVVVDYDELMQAPEHQLQRMATGLELQIDEQELLVYRQQFLDTKLRHSVYSIDNLTTDNTRLSIIKDIYLCLCDIACDRIKLTDATLLEQLDEWLNQFQQFNYFTGLIDKQSSHLVKSDETITQQHRKVLQLEEHINNLEKTLINNEKRINELELHTTNLNNIITDREHRIDDFTKHTDNLNQELDQHHKQLKETEMQLKKTEALLNQIYNSSSWKLTKPLRYIERIIVSQNTTDN